MRQSLRTVVKHAVLAVVVGCLWFLPHARVAAQDDGSGVLEWSPEGQVIDCHEVDCFQRGTCNRRVLEAMSQIKSSASQVAYSRSDFTTRSQIALQVDRLERLRSFVAPECQVPQGTFCAGSSALAAACRAVSRPFDDRGTLPAVESVWALPPLLGSRVTPDKDKKQDGTSEKDDKQYKRDWQSWLKGRWDGWLSLDDGRSARLWLRVTGTTPDGFVKACSDHGMVLGSVDDRGVLALPRRARLDLGARILVWRSAPHYDDLEGVVLVEIEPGREIPNGLVWLSRALTPQFAADLTDYPCQSPELIDRRRDVWFPDR